MTVRPFASWAGLVMCAACAPAACRAPTQEVESEEAPAVVSAVCASAKTRSIAETIELRGIVKPPPEHDVLVVPLAAGRVVDLRVHEGQQVTKGQVLAVIDDPASVAGASEAEASEASMRAELEHAGSVLARAKRLFDQGIAARREVDEAQAAESNAGAALKAAIARNGLARTQRARANVTAPASGVVVRLLRAPGDVVDGTSQTPLAEIADPTILELRVDAPAASLVRLHERDSVEVKLDALPDQVLKGKIVVVAVAVDAQTGLGAVRIELDHTDAALKIGLPGRALVRVAARDNVLVIPASALRRSSAGADEVVLCRAKAGTGTEETVVAEAHEVHTGVRDGDDIEIRDGLRVGDLLVVDHALGLEDGTRLIVTKPTRAPGPEAN